MNRRGFIKSIGIGAATAAVAVTALEGGISFLAEPESIPAVLGEWHEYANYGAFSTEANALAWDDMISNCAAELAYRAGKSVQELTLSA